MNQYKYDYNIIETYVNSLVSRIKARKLEFNYIVGIGRGGLIPATMIGYKLNSPVLNYGVSLYNDNNEPETLKVYQDINFDALESNTKLLVVDDICDTGKTFSHFKELKKNNVIQTTYAALFVKETSIHLVDMCTNIVGEEWITFPWDS